MIQRFKGLQKPKRLECELETLTRTYGKFIAEPLERGFGMTLGNSLHRVLISALEGAAVTSVRTPGVLHEFSSIPGIHEDTADILLNIKQLRVKLHGDQPKLLSLKASGEGKVTASHIAPDPEVEILNPELHIATLEKNGKLALELEVRRGRGYVPAERNRREGMPQDAISIDAAFSPVRRVNFRVEDTRVGQTTDYNKLVLEVWTDGSVLPQEAVASSAKILKEHLGVFLGIEEGEEKAEERERERLIEELMRPVEELELSVRAAKGFKTSNIRYVYELVQKSEAEILKIKNLGRKSLNDLKEILAGMGLSMGMKRESLPIGEADYQKKREKGAR